ncbi:MAG: hypothetical protein HC827_01160 [Cyanobacteria bacterium RM1_2_2]|nr:hypothetical protein [Cyanobacteria bacterium RM1_2_2]
MSVSESDARRRADAQCTLRAEQVQLKEYPAALTRAEVTVDYSDNNQNCQSSPSANLTQWQEQRTVHR